MEYKKGVLNVEQMKTKNTSSFHTLLACNSPTHLSTWARAIQTPPSQTGRRAFKARTSIILESLCAIPYPIQRTTCTQSSTCVVGHFPSRQSHYATDIVATEPGQSHWKLIKSRPPRHRAHRIPHPYQRQGKSLLRRAAAEAVRPVGK